MSQRLSPPVVAVILIVVVIVVAVIGMKAVGIGGGKAIEQPGMRERYEKMTAGRHEAPPSTATPDAQSPGSPTH